ncbi:unnamed protein product, partial [Laminaria digitata]
AASNQVRVVDTRAGKVVGQVPLQKAVREIRFSADGATAYVAASDGVRAIDATSHEVTRLLSLGDAAAIRGLGITPDGRQLLVNTGVALRTLDVASGQVVGEALQLPAGQMGCAVSDDGRFAYLAQMRDKAGGPGGAVVAVDLKAGSITHTVHLDNISPWAIAVAPTTKLAAR